MRHTTSTLNERLVSLETQMAELVTQVTELNERADHGVIALEVVTTVNQNVGELAKAMATITAAAGRQNGRPQREVRPCGHSKALRPDGHCPDCFMRLVRGGMTNAEAIGTLNERAAQASASN